MGRWRLALGIVFACACAPAAAHAAGDNYVSLGDSYTSAPLVLSQHGTPLDCGRSDHNYPSLTAPALGVSSFTDVSCGSAETKDMTGAQTGLPAGGTNPPQFNALRPDTTLVTIGIGGNDAGLVGVGTKCAQLGLTQPTGTACRDNYAPGGKDTVAARIEDARPKVAAVLQGIHARSPRARVAIVGYPDVLPASGNCYPMVPLSSDDVRYVDDLIKRINAMIAQTAAANDAEFVDTYADSAGHDVCTLPPNRWFEGLVPTEPAFPLHPNGKGEASMARSVIAQLRKPRPAKRTRTKLLVGATKGMRRATKRRAFRVKVRSKGAALRGVRLVLRDARGRRLGSSRSFTLRDGKRRSVLIKLRGKLPAGRYRLSAAGRTAAGARVAGAHRVRLKR